MRSKNGVKEWLIPLHPFKCEILKVTNKRKPLKSMYIINGHVLNEVSSKKIPVNDYTIVIKLEHSCGSNMLQSLQHYKST